MQVTEIRDMKYNAQPGVLFFVQFLVCTIFLIGNSKIYENHIDLYKVAQCSGIHFVDRIAPPWMVHAQ